MATLLQDEVRESVSAGQSNSKIFGSFHLGDCEFALPSANIKQVVEIPEKWIKLPRPAPFVQGVFDLRGTLVAVVDLNQLFGFSETVSTCGNVAVVEFDGQCIGFLFDRTGEVFKDNGEEYSEFDTATPIEYVSGVFNRQDGARPVQRLKLEDLFRLPNVPRELKGYQSKGCSKERRQAIRSKYISFLVGNTHCAIPISEVQEVFELQAVKRSALSVGACLGTTEIRGGTIPILDLAALLAQRQDASTVDQCVNGRRVIVMRKETSLFGLVVDSIEDIIAVYQDEIVSFPPAEFAKMELFVGCIVKEGKPNALVFDRESMVNHQIIGEVTKIHDMCPSTLSQQSEQKKVTRFEGIEKFLVFSATEKYAVRVKEIQEIVDLPTDMLQPPGLLQNIVGVHVLRGQTLIAIADLRQAGSGTCDEDEAEKAKVLIFDVNGGKAGLIVNSLDSIDSVSEEDKMSYPAYFAGEERNSSAMIECITRLNKCHQRETLPVFSLRELLDRAITQARTQPMCGALMAAH